MYLILCPDYDKILYSFDNNSHSNVLSFGIIIESHNQQITNLLLLDLFFQIVLEEQSMEETPLPKGIAIEDEIKILRRKLKEHVHAPPASIVVNKMLMKKPYSLDCFKSMDEKEELLDEAIQCGNGDAILSVNI